MEISLLQAFALGIIAFIAGLDMFNGLTHMHRPVVLGPLVGLVLGDLHTGILTGGTLELVWMGLAPLAGAQPPNVIIGTIVGTAFAITTGVKPDVAVGVAVPFAVGSWLPTTVTAPLNTIHAALKRIAQRCQRGGPGAQVLGSYLEGPYFTPQNKGAHPPELFRELEIAELDQLIAVSQHTLRVVALAPEKEGALLAIRHLKQQNVRVMLGHSAATWQQTRAAFDAGADGLVHCYNGMTGLHHREPGMVGAGLTDKRAWLELIADGHHVHPAAMSLCCCCAKERIVLITDAMQAAGMPDGRYTLCGEEVQMHGGVVRTASGGLAGSTLSVDAAVRNMVELTGVTPAEAIHMALLHPARMLGVDGVLGSLKPGKRASVVALDSGLHVQQIWIQGQLASF